MTAKVGYASISEKGTTSGSPGNQSGSELKTRNYYDFGQTIYFRFNSSSDAWWMSDIIERIIKNKNVGYGQPDRATIFKILKNNGWQSGQIKTKCNCDCSMLAVVGFNCIYEKELLKSDTYSGNIIDRLVATGKGTKHTITKGYKAMCGDIVVKPGKHVVIVIGSCK